MIHSHYVRPLTIASLSLLLVACPGGGEQTSAGSETSQGDSTTMAVDPDTSTSVMHSSPSNRNPFICHTFLGRRRSGRTRPGRIV